MEGDILRHLDDRILESPSFAIETVEKEVINMGRVAAANLKIATAALTDRNESFCQEVFDNEKKLNHLDTELTDYLVKINNLSLNDSQHLIVKKPVLYYRRRGADWRSCGEPGRAGPD